MLLYKERKHKMKANSFITQLLGFFWNAFSEDIEIEPSYVKTKVPRKKPMKNNETVKDLNVVLKKLDKELTEFNLKVDKYSKTL